MTSPTPIGLPRHRLRARTRLRSVIRGLGGRNAAARQLNLSRQCIASWWHGESVPSWDTLADLRLQFPDLCDLNDLVAGE